MLKYVKTFGLHPNLLYICIINKLNIITMKKILIGAVALSLLFVACKKDEMEIYGHASDSASVKNYDPGMHEHECYMNALPYETHLDTASQQWIYCYGSAVLDTAYLNCTDDVLLQFDNEHTKPVRLVREVIVDTINQCDCYNVN